MEYGYSVQGMVEKPFVLRGFFFPIGKRIEMYVSKSELPFLKERCQIEAVIDLKKANPENAMPVRRNTSQRGSRNGSTRKPNQSASKGEV